MRFVVNGCLKYEAENQTGGKRRLEFLMHFDTTNIKAKVLHCKYCYNTYLVLIYNTV